jgi:hypothetical protein
MRTSPPPAAGFDDEIDGTNLGDRLGDRFAPSRIAFFALPYALIDRPTRSRLPRFQASTIVSRSLSNCAPTLSLPTRPLEACPRPLHVREPAEELLRVLMSFGEVLVVALHVDARALEERRGLLQHGGRVVDAVLRHAGRTMITSHTLPRSPLAASMQAHELELAGVGAIGDQHRLLHRARTARSPPTGSPSDTVLSAFDRVRVLPVRPSLQITIAVGVDGVDVEPEA